MLRLAATAGATALLAGFGALATAGTASAATATAMTGSVATNDHHHMDCGCEHGDDADHGDKGDKGDRGDKGDKGDKGDRGDRGDHDGLQIGIDLDLDIVI